MALVDCGAMHYGKPNTIATTTSTMAMTNSAAPNSDKAAFIMRAPRTGSITGFRFRVVGAATPKGIKVILQTVDTATGLPTGTAYGGCVASAAQTPAANTTYALTFATPASATAGDRFAAVIQWADDADPGSITIGYAGGSSGVPYCAQRTGGAAWAVVNGFPIGGPLYGSTYYYCGSYAGVVSATAFKMDTPAGDEIGNKFTIPYIGRCCGIWATLDLDGDADLVLYDASGSVLGSNSLLATCRGSTASAGAAAYFTPVTLQASTLYRVAIRATATAATLSCFDVNAEAAAVMAMLAGGSTMSKCVRVDAGEWDDTTAPYPSSQVLVGPIFDQIDAAPGGAWAG